MTIQEDLRRKLSGNGSGNSSNSSSSSSSSSSSTSDSTNSHSGSTASTSTSAPTTNTHTTTIPSYPSTSHHHHHHQPQPPHVEPPPAAFAAPLTHVATPLTATLSLPIQPSAPDYGHAHAAGSDPERTYVFPAAPRSIGRVGEIMAAGRGHARSVSHGGNASLSCSVPNSAGSMGAPAAAPTLLSSGKVLRSAMKGHQRAFSQGQISIKDTLAAANAANAATAAAASAAAPLGPAFKRPGHNRVSSKTDFILPPGHKDSPQAVPRGDLAASTALGVGGGGGGLGANGSIGAAGGSAGSGGGRTGSGHSRQASRSESIYTLRRAELPPWWRRWWCCRGLLGGTKFADDRDRSRIVVPNHTVPAKTPRRDHPNGKRVGNKIRTTKYTLLSFVPNNLLEQFHRLANLYFIFIVLLNWYIDAFAKEVTMIPVAFVLGVTAVKDLFEDRRRRASDQRINNSTCRVYNGEAERYKKILWRDVRVGDLVHLSNNETVPADILLLRSSNANGVCFIDTCDLDGESNLKSREVVRGFADKQATFTPSRFTSRVEVDAPSTKIYRFHGAIVHESGERVPISTESLLLRESRLKNTDFVEGLVVYAGHETKAMLNNSGPRYKRSKLEQQMNMDVLWCVVILLVLCLVGAVGCKLWLAEFEGKTVYFLPFEVHAGYEAFITFWTNIIILQIMIPLSLYVTIEVCKVMQVYHIHNNTALFDGQTNQRTECRAMNITEELGQVQHIFSDKTGTLTENKMLFRRCTVNGTDYNHPPTELELAYSTAQTPAPPVRCNPKLLQDLGATDALHRSTAEAQRIQEFLLVLTVCNTVVVSASPHRDLMNASGMIESPSSSSGDRDEQLQRQLNGSTVSATQLGVSMLSADTDGNGSVLSAAMPLPNGAAPPDRYARLTESRSITPSPPLLALANATGSNGAGSSSGVSQLASKPAAQHVPSLSPISSSTESTPTTKSPQMSVKRQRNLQRSASGGSMSMSPTAKARTIISSKFTSITSMLANKAHRQKLAARLRQSTPRRDMSQVAAGGASGCGPDGRPIFEAESPDELALVNAAFSYGCCLVNRGPEHIIVSTGRPGGHYGAVMEYELLKVLPFDSARKCMSVVVRRVGTAEVRMYTKGADTAVMGALAECGAGSAAAELRDRTQQQLDLYARQGLRVLVLAKRQLSAGEFVEWLRQHKEIERSLEGRERRLRESYASLERNLELLGATGIEDRLQEGVPETIDALRSAGIAVWVLTGDKPETAINVAYSARLFQTQMELLRLTARSRNAAESAIAFYMAEVEKQQVTHPARQRALVVDGKTLTFILDLRSNLTKPFLRLTKHCASVLCCRATPLQKAFLVKVVKEELRLNTLAIGDGANDVSMIQMADVGIGISGQEGMQAVMASDFTLSRFKFLQPLLLQHGFWSYDRLARMILYFFYKNATFVFLIFWFQLYNGFSGVTMFDQIYLMLYNLLFTSLPPMVIGVYDKVVGEDLLGSRPYLYRYGRLGRAYRPHSFWIVMLDAVYQSLVVFFIAMAAYADSTIDVWEFGATTATSCLFANLVHGAIEFRSWTILHVLSLIGSVGAYYFFSLIYNAACVNCFGVPSQYWVIYVCMASPTHWLILLLTTVVCVIPRMIFRVLETTVWPDDCIKAQVEQKRAQRRGEDLLVAAWSRSTSASSIYRVSDCRSKNQTVTSIS